MYRCNSFAISCNYVQSVSTIFFLLLFTSISFYNWCQSQFVIMNSIQLSIPILDGKNYNRWCVQMRVLFDYHELWNVVESGVSTLADNATKTQRVAHCDQKKKDKKALYLIHQGMNDETFEQIEGATTASEAWIILSTNYKDDDKINRCVFKP